ncbi:hypothetical protein AC623_12575 [Bacillus sp. FJAT-27231]|uniref:DUF309 domain-containing protein n=1 Tax=Bacillus sp. FJAT-27231 TaxID=1679168 RepID=UPI000670B234|nr:DUF309 domain-containing protein [Bacillus sp. FJAT-27231]KMY54659.1 hypothetical protein AC623_12575 [Bacillus sp. FJAT-27231]
MYSFPLPYLSFLVYFHENHDYFECHEVLEEYWKEKTDQSRDSVWVGLIQAAVSLYHHRRGNLPGAQKLAGKALKIFKKRKDELIALGIDSETLINQFTHRLQEIKAGTSFTDMTIPFADQKVVQQYRHFLESGALSLENDPNYLYNKHLARDRSQVLAAREQSLRERRKLLPTMDPPANP